MAAKRVYVQCGCGGVMLVCAEDMLPSACRQCGHKFTLPACEQGYEKPSRRRGHMAVKRVDVLCGCGWGMRDCAVDMLPSACRQCGYKFTLPACEQGYEKPSRKRRGPMAAVKRVDVLCGCGWGMLACAVDMLPSACRQCGRLF